MKKYIAFAAIAALAFTTPAGAEESKKKSDVSREQAQTERVPDNTAHNAAVERQNQMTAQDQTSGDIAMKLTKEIRQKIVERDDLSTYAKNVKIISDERGTVTLKGPVRSNFEKTEVARLAQSVEGAKHVRNEIEVAPNS